VEETVETPTPKPAAPPSTRRIRTTAEGEIVFEELAPEEVAPALQGPSSTLEALDWGDGTTVPVTPATPETEEGTGEDVDELHGGDAAVRAPKAGGRKRVAVDGPDNVADDLRILALRLGARVPDEAIAEALAEASRSGDHTMRRAAFEGLAAQAAAGALPAQARAVILAAIGDRDPVVATIAARAALTQSDAELSAAVAAQADHADATMRALALQALGPGHAARLAKAAGADPARMPRDVAMALLLKTGDSAAITEAVRGCVASGHADTLAVTCTSSPAIRDQLLGLLAANAATVTTVRTALDALGRTAAGQTPAAVV
ncbi:MAG: hypothetical protein AAF698_02565, partial [Pseudomonadota bacterium]